MAATDPIVMAWPGHAMTYDEEPMSTVDDETGRAELLDRALTGDEAALSRIIRLYRKREMSIAWSILRNHEDAEDVVQESFLRLFEQRRGLDPERPIAPWLDRVTANLSLDRLRRRSVRSTEPLDQEMGGDRPSPLATAEMSEVAAAIDAAISSLPETRQIVARLILVEGFDRKEVAEFLDLTEGTIRSHLSLARGHLRKRLKEHWT